MVVDLKKAFAAVVAFEKAHSRKLSAVVVYLLTHPTQAHDAVVSIGAQIAALLAGVPQ